MKSNKGCFITENELKTIDTHEISKIILKNGTILEMTPIKKSTKICTCHKHNNMSKSPLRNTIQYKEPQKFLSLNNNINQKQSLRDTLAYHRSKKLLTIKLPNKKEEQNNIKHNIETFSIYFFICYFYISNSFHFFSLWKKNSFNEKKTCK